MKRSGPLARRTPLKRRGPHFKAKHARTVAARPAHKAETHERVYGSAERNDWIHRQPCIVTGERGEHIVAHHVIGGGVGRKSDAEWTVPLRADLHEELHAHGRNTFQWKYGVNLREKAALIEKRWQAERARRGEA